MLITCATLEFVARSEANAQPSAIYRRSWLLSQVSPNAQNIAQLQQGTLVARSR
jgi:hypothetical protein